MFFPVYSNYAHKSCPNEQNGEFSNLIRLEQKVCISKNYQLEDLLYMDFFLNPNVNNNSCSYYGNNIEIK